MEGRTESWSRTIYGELASKANSRKSVLINGVPRFIKSDKARRYLEDFARQCPQLNPIFLSDLYVEARIYYRTRRPDLDESLLLDALQGRVYKNDRQVRKKLVEWALDADNPRTELRISPLAGSDRSSGARHIYRGGKEQD